MHVYILLKPSKYLQVAVPENSGNVTSPRTENTSLSSKMKRMLSSPKVTRGKAAPSPNKTFGKYNLILILSQDFIIKVIFHRYYNNKSNKAIALWESFKCILVSKLSDSMYN